jgi:hypothetical protein
MNKKEIKKPGHPAHSQSLYWVNHHSGSLELFLNRKIIFKTTLQNESYHIQVICQVCPTTYLPDQKQYEQVKVYFIGYDETVLRNVIVSDICNTYLHILLYSIFSFC